MNKTAGEIVFITLQLMTAGLCNLFSQNYIPNPSFEEITFNSDTNAQNWNKYFGHDTPDYFNFNKENPYNNIFDNYIGGISPKDGDGFAGIFCYRVYPQKKIQNIREFIEAPLKENLKKDSVYNFKISVCLDEESNVAIGNFGVFFTSKSKEFNKESKLFLTEPSIHFDEIILDQSKDWMTLEARYKATGGENYIVIGNFYPDNKTYLQHRSSAKKTDKKQKWNLAKRELAAYYYIDDMHLEPVVSMVSEIQDSTNAISSDEFIISKLKTDSAIILNNINFKFNTTDFIDNSYKDLTKLLRFMQNNPEITILINGYTDNIGSRKYNLNLSYNRSLAVKNYLVQRGISEKRISCEGFGFDNPLMKNDTDENRQMNRRVEFVIISE